VKDTLSEILEISMKTTLGKYKNTPVPLSYVRNHQNIFFFTEKEAIENTKPKISKNSQGVDILDSNFLQASKNFVKFLGIFQNFRNLE
jgi:hypothetical protein